MVVINILILHTWFDGVSTLSIFDVEACGFNDIPSVLKLVRERKCMYVCIIKINQYLFPMI